jgi:hypothetical protein
VDAPGVWENWSGGVIDLVERRAKQLGEIAAPTARAGRR